MRKWLPSIHWVIILIMGGCARDYPDSAKHRLNYISENELIVVREAIDRKLVTLSKSEREVIAMQSPLRSSYRMAADFGQYFYEWKLSGACSVTASFEGSLKDLRWQHVQVTIRK